MNTERERQSERERERQRQKETSRELEVSRWGVILFKVYVYCSINFLCVVLQFWLGLTVFPITCFPPSFLVPKPLFCWTYRSLLARRFKKKFSYFLKSHSNVLMECFCTFDINTQSHSVIINNSEINLHGLNYWNLQLAIN